MFSFATDNCVLSVVFSSVGFSVLSRCGRWAVFFGVAGLGVCVCAHRLGRDACRVSAALCNCLVGFWLDFSSLSNIIADFYVGRLPALKRRSAFFSRPSSILLYSRVRANVRCMSPTVSVIKVVSSVSSGCSVTAATLTTARETLHGTCRYNLTKHCVKGAGKHTSRELSNHMSFHRTTALWLVVIHNNTALLQLS